MTTPSVPGASASTPAAPGACPACGATAGQDCRNALDKTLVRRRPHRAREATQ